MLLNPIHKKFEIISLPLYRQLIPPYIQRRLLKDLSHRQVPKNNDIRNPINRYILPPQSDNS